MYLGKLKRNEVIPLTAVFSGTVSGTPQYRILTVAHAGHVALTNLTNDGGTPVWYKSDQTVGGSDTVGMYKVEYVGIVSGTTEYYYDTFDVSLNDTDDIAGGITILDGKLDIIDTNVDTANDNIVLILVDTVAIISDTTQIINITTAIAAKTAALTFDANNNVSSTLAADHFADFAETSYP